MATYSIKKTNNGEYKEIEKTFVLDTSKFRSKSDTLCFNVLGEENPTIFDLDVFEKIMMSQIDQGFMESLEYKDGLLIAATRDGNTIKKYTYDFGWNRLNGNSLEEEPRQTDDNTRVVEKHFVLDVRKFMGHNDTLCFNVLGEENPVVFDLSMFASNILGQIKEGLVESLEFKDGLLITIIRDGNTIKKYTYDFGFGKSKDKAETIEDGNTIEVEKHFALDIDKFKGHNDTLYFNVLGEKNPTVYDLDVFVSNILGQINDCLIESLEYKDDLLIAIIHDGNTIKKYTYDFGFGRLKDNSSEKEPRQTDDSTIIEKHFVLDIDKFKSRRDTLCFNVEGEENPTVYDLDVFVNSMIGLIGQGMMHSLDFKDDLLVITINDGKTIKKYSYDFGFSKLKPIINEDSTIIEKHFVLDIDKYRGHGDTLSFNVEGEENPTVYDLGAFLNNMIGLIGDGLMQSLELKDDLLITTVNDGKTIKKYTYDLGWSKLKNVSFGMGANNSFDELKSYILKIVSFYNENPNNALEELKGIIYKVVSFYNENPNNSLEELKSVIFKLVSLYKDSPNHSMEELKGLIYKIVSYYEENPNNALEELKSLMYKVVSYYNENPNREIMSKQKYIRMILDIMDGDRLPKLENNDEILRVFQVYHANKAEILEILLDNVVFYDDNGNVLDYSSFIKTRKLEAIKYDILNQMEIKMLMFAVANNAYDLYQDYNNKTHIMPVEIQYKYVDEEGNEVQPEVEEVEAGTIFSVGREIVGKGLSDLRDIVGAGADFASSVASKALKKVKEHKRTK